MHGQTFNEYNFMYDESLCIKFVLVYILQPLLSLFLSLSHFVCPKESDMVNKNEETILYYYLMV